MISYTYLVGQKARGILNLAKYFFFKQGHLTNDSVIRCHRDIYDFISNVDVADDKVFFLSMPCIIVSVDGEDLSTKYYIITKSMRAL